jgi:hypothetical protein
MFFDVVLDLQIKDRVHKCARTLKNNSTTGIFKSVFEFQTGIQYSEKPRTIHPSLAIYVDHLAGGILQESVHVDCEERKPGCYVYKRRVNRIQNSILSLEMHWNKTWDIRFVCTVNDVSYVIFLNKIRGQKDSRTKHDTGVQFCGGISQEAF